ncbi:hypothetical protein HNP46_002191 [Pseudomonas nitritireducens]|uniref:Uncharacterized protein n=1 Tax=Pseudomonas nitroreducens TaxID=46680 RepID=A0A7W7P160_PSENT|nr:hypothetical protein [Pseudomonas nitritireducens]MBB4863344.1 hypothetical protein [Pseudomonas nitritireducens]
MTKRTLLGAAMPFAHLLGLSARAAEDDEKSSRAKSRRAEDDPDDSDAGEEEDDEPKGRKAKGKAADDDDDRREDDPDAEDEEDDEPKGRKAKGRRAEDDPDAEDEEDDDDKPNSKAVAADRRRCAAIVAHGLELGSVEQACVFAFDTNMSQASAMAALSAGSRADGRKGGLRERMGSGRVKPVGDDDGGKTPNGMTETASAIVRAAERAQGKH